MPDNERQLLGAVIDARGNARGQAVRTVLRVPKKHPRLRQVVPVEDYIECVVEACKMLDDGQRRDLEGALAIPDTCETRSVSEYSQDKHTINEDEYTAYFNSRSIRSSSGGDALRVALTRFCVQHGLEKDSWNPGIQR